MSSSSTPIDSESLDQARQQLRDTVEELEALAHTEIPPEEFYREFLSRLVAVIAAQGGAIWSLQDQGRYELAFQINLHATGLIEDDTISEQHGQLLARIAETGSAEIVPPHSGSSIEEIPANASEYLILIAPLVEGDKTQAIVELFHNPAAPPNVQQGYMRFLLQLCGIATEYLKNRRLRSLATNQSFLGRLEQFTRTIHKSLDWKTTAYTVANEGRRLIECDRVSVAVHRRGAFVVEAISGQDTLEKRAATVKLLSQVATAVGKAGETVWYTGDSEEIPPQIEEAIHTYVDKSHSKTLVIIPLVRPEEEQAEPAEPTKKQKQQPKQPNIFAVLIIEQIDTRDYKHRLEPRIDAFTTHATTALDNALRYHELFLMPLWRAIGRMKWIVSARTLPKTILISVAALILLVGMIVVPADFNLESPGALQPTIRRDVFARVDGVVIDVQVEHGKIVAAGDLLLAMRNTDLEVERADILGRKASVNEQLQSTRRALLNQKELSVEEQNRLAAQKLELEATLTSLRQQELLYDTKREMLKVHSPIAGQIVTWEVAEQLENRPVARGQVLLNVADPKGDWELELHMPEDSMGYVASAMADQKNPLVVSYILATEPDVTRYGTIKEIHSIAEVRGEEGNTVLIRVKIDKSELPELRPGATVTAKVHCGRRPIGYVWFHDVINFIRTKILFRIF